MAASRGQRLQRLERLAWVLDSSIRLPGTRYRVGVDGLLGLLPGIGDLVGAALSAYILVQGAGLGAPASVLLRMGLNTGLDALVGLVPLVGDLFDLGFKANERNIRLLRGYEESPGTVRRSSRLVVAMVLGGLLMLFAGLLVLSIAVLRWLLSALAGA